MDTQNNVEIQNIHHIRPYESATVANVAARGCTLVTVTPSSLAAFRCIASASNRSTSLLYFSGSYIKCITWGESNHSIDVGISCSARNVSAIAITPADGHTVSLSLWTNTTGVAM
eukprot:NODE_8061_length_725_cov_145.488372_g7809_i0.p2 GENE.NODE_8061_length_725_cov_145.488372_g7809_i0~~NODE_8061_length_725_cov_145.488372_g7809_i0.p2  ORF type:complete len:130 (-),score=13.57 NODE_8061_length_725_cov_145.488372_g7809_i0:335-679(-)